MGAKVGDRIGAVLSGNDTQVKFLGYGTRLEDSVPKGAGGIMGETMEKSGLTNPTLSMDDGSTVYGCECWWGSEESMREKIEAWMNAGAEILHVNIRDAREANKVTEELIKPDSE